MTNSWNVRATRPGIRTNSGTTNPTKANMAILPCFSSACRWEVSSFVLCQESSLLGTSQTMDGQMCWGSGSVCPSVRPAHEYTVYMHTWSGSGSPNFTQHLDVKTQARYHPLNPQNVSFHYGRLQQALQRGSPGDQVTHVTPESRLGVINWEPAIPMLGSNFDSPGWGFPWQPTSLNQGR